MADDGAAPERRGGGPPELREQALLERGVGGAIGVDLPEKCARLRDWYARVSARPSAKLDLAHFPRDMARELLQKALVS